MRRTRIDQRDHVGTRERICNRAIVGEQYEPRRHAAARECIEERSLRAGSGPFRFRRHRTDDRDTGHGIVAVL